MNQVNIIVKDNKRTIFDLEVDLNLRFFTFKHLDCLIKRFKVSLIFYSR